jgi:GNAT superfamily N-acetyltransferase
METNLDDISIRRAHEEDLDAIWDIFHAHLATGATYSFEAHTPKSVCDDYWLGPNVDNFVARDQGGRGTHGVNASSMVGGAAQGQGIGYLAMQFNYAVSTNQAAVALWRKLGLSIAGTLAGAYRHERLGYVDALAMYQLLSDPA